MVLQRKWVRRAWVGCSTIAIAAGAVIALGNFPEAGFAQNPTGHFGYHLVGFAASVATPVAAVQCLLLWRFLPRITVSKLMLLLLWMIATAAGYMAMIMPLWWFDAWLFTFAPWLVAAPMLPGAFGLGLMQWLIAAEFFGARYYWITVTVTGAVIGSIVGLVIGMFLQPIPIEVTWAAVTGLCIAVPQGQLLAQRLGVDGTEGG